MTVTVNGQQQQTYGQPLPYQGGGYGQMQGDRITGGGSFQLAQTGPVNYDQRLVDSTNKQFDTWLARPDTDPKWKGVYGGKKFGSDGLWHDPNDPNFKPVKWLPGSDGKPVAPAPAPAPVARAGTASTAAQRQNTQDTQWVDKPGNFASALGSPPTGAFGMPAAPTGAFGAAAPPPIRPTLAQPPAPGPTGQSAPGASPPAAPTGFGAALGESGPMTTRKPRLFRSGLFGQNQ